MKRYGDPKSIVTDRLRSYRAAMRVIGNAAHQDCAGRLNSYAENSHQPFRRRENVMAKLGDTGTLQKFISIHASAHNLFNHKGHINRHDVFKHDHAAALAEWRHPVASELA